MIDDIRAAIDELAADLRYLVDLLVAIVIGAAALLGGPWSVR